MTNWQDKYKDLKVGESAWYWHKDKNTYWKWTIVKVGCGRSKQDDCDEIYIDGTAYYSYLVSEDFPNGPRCMTPEEIEKLLSPKEVVELPNTEVYQELEDSIVDSIVEEPYVLGSCGHLGCRGFTKRVDHSYCFNCKELVIGESPILN